MPVRRAWVRRRGFAGLLGLAAVSLLASGMARADALDDISSKGVLVAGTKADYQPFGFRDPSGAIVGFEPDLARDLAAALGVKLDLVPVVSTDRIPLLLAGKIDLIIATMNDTPERRKLIDLIEPGYYASGVNALAPRSLHLHVWQQLRGKSICMIDGSFYVGEITQRYEPQVIAFKNTGDMYDALMHERCRSVVYDDTAIVGRLQSPDWRDYEMPLLSILVEPWGIGVRHGEARLERRLSDQVKEWHRSGRIAILEDRWHIPHSAFAEDMHRKYVETQ
ncbi:MAG TPA: transporter substrate-binding domain-containing protein [Stellaceae bacterium]|nr:transporter substrate-binding domain-containing protein [Stellaceae bacterium]